MVACLEKSAQDGVALFCVLQANALEMLKENILRFAHGFARRRCVIVNAGVQHGAKKMKLNFIFKVQHHPTIPQQSVNVRPWGDDDVCGLTQLPLESQAYGRTRGYTICCPSPQETLDSETFCRAVAASGHCPGLRLGMVLQRSAFVPGPPRRHNCLPRPACPGVCGPRRPRRAPLD